MSEKREKVSYDQLNIRVPEKLHHDFKVETVKRGTTESDVIRDYMTKYLADANKPVVY